MITLKEWSKRDWFLPVSGGILLILATLFLYHDFLQLSHLGHDSYPIIISARIENATDLIGTFTEELMDGRYPRGHFYRPVLNLSFALDHAVWGLRPFGYHLTDLIILCVTVFLFAQVLGRMGGKKFAAAGLAAGLFFVVHPVHLNVLPVPPRRADTLTLLFMLLALLAAGGQSWQRRLGAPLFVLLAVSAKETGAITPFLIFTGRILLPHKGAVPPLRQAIHDSLPSLIILIPFVIARQTVIGGLGGHMELSLSRLLHNALFILPEFLRSTFYPYSILAGIAKNPTVSRSIALLLLATSPFLLHPGRARRIGIFIFCWFLYGWTIHAFSGSISPWYAIHTVGPLSLYAGLVLHETIRAFRNRKGGVRRSAAILSAILIATLFLVNLVGTPPLHHHPEWHDLSTLTNRFLEKAGARLDAAGPGSTVEIGGLPLGAKHRPGSPIVIAAGMTDYTVQAWTDLIYPNRNIRVAYRRSLPAPPAPDETLLIVSTKNEGRR